MRVCLGGILLLWLLDLRSDIDLFFPLLQLPLGLSRQSMLDMGLLMAVLFTFGIWLSLTGALIGIFVLTLFHLNPLLYSPALPFEIWLLCCLSIVGLESSRQSSVQTLLHRGAWALLATGYLITGLDKVLHSESWRSGTALFYILSGPLARFPELFAFFQSLPSSVQTGMSWSIPALEILFLPFCFFTRTRGLAWWCLTGVHVLILIVLWLPSVSIGMLLFHFYLIDSPVEFSSPKYKDLSK